MLKFRRSIIIHVVYSLGIINDETNSLFRMVTKSNILILFRLSASWALLYTNNSDLAAYKWSKLETCTFLFVGWGEVNMPCKNTTWSARMGCQLYHVYFAAKQLFKRNTVKRSHSNVCIIKLYNIKCLHRK